MRFWILLLVLVVVGLSMCQQPGEEGQKVVEKAVISNTTVDSSYFEKLGEIIEGSSDPKEKERAILTMAQIAVMLNDSERVVSYLKDVAMNAKDENVVAASYAAIDLIRDYYPIEAIGEMVVNVNGSLKPGSPIKVVVTVKTYKDCNGAVGVKRVPAKFELLSDIRYKFEQSAEESKDYTFEFIPKESGEYVITISMFLSMDRFDYQEVEQKLILKISEGGGEVIYM